MEQSVNDYIISFIVYIMYLLFAPSGNTYYYYPSYKIHTFKQKYSQQ